MAPNFHTTVGNRTIDSNVYSKLQRLKRQQIFLIQSKNKCQQINNTGAIRTKSDCDKIYICVLKTKTMGNSPEMVSIVLTIIFNFIRKTLQIQAN